MKMTPNIMDNVKETADRRERLNDKFQQALLDETNRATKTPEQVASEARQKEFNRPRLYKRRKNG